MDKTTVFNLMDDRRKAYDLTPDEAVVAAFEEFEKGNTALELHLLPQKHPFFKEYRCGFACGDWIAYKRRPGCKKPSTHYEAPVS